MSVYPKFLLLLLALALCLSATAQKKKPRPEDFGIKSKKALAFFLEGEQQARYRDRDRAIALYQQAVALEPRFALAHYRLGVNAYLRKRYEEAVEHLQIAAKEDPARYGGFFLAESYFYTGHYEEAIPQYERFLQSRRGKESDRNKAQLNLRHARFASVAIKDPIRFELQNLGPKVNSPQDEYLPHLNADNTYLLFTSRRPDAVGGFNRAMNDYGEDFYYSEYVDGEWQMAKNLGPPINTPSNEGASSLTQDGRIIFFTACNLPDGQGSCDLYYAVREGEQWSAPQNLGPQVNSDAWESQPCLSQDGKTLYFTSTRPGGQGSSDIWYSEYKEGEWQTPQNLGPPVNTPGQEFSPFLHADGLSLYFSSNFHPGFGAKDLFVSERQNDGSWSTPKNLGYPLNTSGDETNIFVTAQGNRGLINSTREEGFGGSDLYMFELDERIRPHKATFVRGTVIDSLTQAPVKALIRMVDVESGDTVRQISSDGLNGRFLMSLPLDREYAAFAEAPGYLFASKHFYLKQLAEDTYFDITIPLQPIQEGSQVVLHNIFFESGKYELKESSQAELKVLLDFLQSNPGLKVEIQGHTDDVGAESDNLLLSQNRANAVREYLIASGIDPGRVTAKGYGESMPVAPNDNEAGRAQNRRTEFKVVAL
ncbi:MAG: tetratricopeptide repeat protein [Bacteroidetes bacterium]|nr:MAG: tetratricopeptide repeat protein [Bacteroidota bacterium]